MLKDLIPYKNTPRQILKETLHKADVSLFSAILENMYVTPKNFGVAPDDLRQLLAYFTRPFGRSNRWRGVNPKHLKKMFPAVFPK